MLYSAQLSPLSCHSCRYPVTTHLDQQVAVAQKIAVLAVRSLHAELVLYPKPGLVSLRDNGSHTDMTPQTFMRSLFSLRHYFKAIALAGMRHADFAELKQLGIEAEQRMLVATRGINTHRGALFALGMLCAASAACYQQQIPVKPVHAQSIRASLLHYWGGALAQHSVPEQTGQLPSHGLLAAQQFAASGAREEAARGFPSVFELALPRLQKTLQERRTMTQAQIDSLFTLIAHISDTNIYYRGGMAGAQFARTAAQQFMACGGTSQSDWMDQAEQCHQQFIERRLSPGGAADLLAASCFVHHVVQEFS